MSKRIGNSRNTERAMKVGPVTVDTWATAKPLNVPELLARRAMPQQAIASSTNAGRRAKNMLPVL
jgi:hypothetical protein